MKFILIIDKIVEIIGKMVGKWLKNDGKSFFFNNLIAQQTRRKHLHPRNQPEKRKQKQKTAAIIQISEYKSGATCSIAGTSLSLTKLQ